MTIADVIAWKVPTAEYVRNGHTFAFWSHSTEPEPDLATLHTWQAEYVAAGAERSQAFTRDNTKMVRAVAQAAFEHHSNPGWTLQDYRARIKQIYRTL